MILAAAASAQLISPRHFSSAKFQRQRASRCRDYARLIYDWLITWSAAGRAREERDGWRDGMFDFQPVLPHCRHAARFLPVSLMPRPAHLMIGAPRAK